MVSLAINIAAFLFLLGLGIASITALALLCWPFRRQLWGALVWAGCVLIAPLWVAWLILSLRWVRMMSPRAWVVLAGFATMCSSVIVKSIDLGYAGIGVLMFGLYLFRDGPGGDAKAP